MAVYLLHFDRPYKHAGHYIGYTPGSVDKRIQMHRKGTGARLMAVIKAAGIGFTVANVWPEYGREEERRLKRQKNAPALCEICRADASRRRFASKIAKRAVSLIGEETLLRIQLLTVHTEEPNGVRDR